MWVVVAVLAVIVLGLVGYLWLWPQIVNDSRASGPSTSTSTVVVPAPGPAPAQGGAGPAPATGESMPSYSTPCPSVFSSPTLGTSAVGSSVTSCEFAEEVRSEYLRQGVRGGVVTIAAYSPVTGRTYTMTCSGTTVVTCSGGNDAVVYLY
ncbi:serine/threonine protein kinase [Rhodococcus aetherivorans]|nr:serine/threonine protein kinase [Rhodococcus aetherivorans]